jgi:hypothetical protein
MRIRQEDGSLVIRKKSPDAVFRGEVACAGRAYSQEISHSMGLRLAALGG